MSSKSVLIMAGGTGGHVFPGLALASELQARGIVVEWMGTTRGIEASIVPGANIPLHTIKVSGVRGRGVFNLLLAPFKITNAVLSAWKIIQSIKPSVVVGFGGYASGPGGVAAKISGLPLIIHEQNAIAGTTNKYLARVASRVATAFPSVFANGEFVGNPIRKGIERKNSTVEKQSNSTNILVMGGSRGARAINQLMPNVIPLVSSAVKITHQSGKEDKNSTIEAYRKNGVDANVVEFINDINEAFSWADLVVCRSGASTVTEIAYVGLPAVLIPFPYAIDDHQTANARFLEQAGAAKVVQEKELSENGFAELLGSLCGNKSLLATMAENSKNAACLDAKSKLADMCEVYING